MIRKALEWRQHTMGPEAAESVAATLDLARCLRRAARDAGRVAADTSSAGQSDGGVVTATVTEATVAAAAAAEAAALTDEATALDARWVAGLQRLCDRDAQEAGEASAGGAWAEQVHLLASAAAMHKDWSEALHLLTMARPAIEALHAGKGLDWAEFLSSAGESCTELQQYAEAAGYFATARAAAVELVEAGEGARCCGSHVEHDVVACWVAAMDASQAHVLSCTGDLAAASPLFDSSCAQMRALTQAPG